MKQTKHSLFPYYKEIDISMEKYRVYVFSGGDEVRIDNPKFLIVSDNGHRVGDSVEVSHYIPYKWIHLYWENYSPEKGMFYCQGRTKK